MKKKVKLDLRYDISNINRIKIDENTIYANKYSGERYILKNGKKRIVEKRDPKNRNIHINVSTGERFIYVGGKKKNLKKVTKNQQKNNNN
tara:strand:+ start:327 stop:596 length:270 start_codon:yes stop_codon:yes gene_type:complete